MFNKELIGIINNDLKNILSEKRYIHSLGVMKKAEELAIKYNANLEKAKLART